MTSTETHRPWLQRTFTDALDWAEATHGDREAVVHGATRLSFAQLAARVRSFARGLIALGVAPGEKVALWMSDSPDWLVARWAVPTIGAVLVPVNTRFRSSDVAFVLSQSDATTLIVEQDSVHASYFDILGQLDPGYRVQSDGEWRCAALPALRRVIGSGADLPDSMRPFAVVERIGRAALEDGVLAHRAATVAPDDVAQILYTSGTTSFPKGAMVCHGPLLQNNFHAIECLALTPADRYLSCVPLFTATGTFYTLALWLAGAAMVIADGFDAARFCALVEREKITLSFFVDTIVQDLRAFTERDRYDLSSLRTGTGAPLPTASFRWVSDVMRVPELTSAYGMSETSNAVARTHTTDPFDKRSTTVGRPVDGVEIRIVDVTSNAPLGNGAIGEICIRGFQLMRGYYRQPDEDAKAFDAEGWLHSGDLGELDADGFLIYRGRVKEMIKPGGFNVATQEIEVFLKTHPAVREAMVVGVPDPRLGEVAYAYIETTAGETAPPDALSSALSTYCRAHIASFKVPRHFEFVTDWPRTGSQKIRKTELKDRALQTLAAREAEGASS